MLVYVLKYMLCTMKWNHQLVAMNSNHVENRTKCIVLSFHSEIRYEGAHHTSMFDLNAYIAWNNFYDMANYRIQLPRTIMYSCCILYALHLCMIIKRLSCRNDPADHVIIKMLSYHGLATVSSLTRELPYLKNRSEYWDRALAWSWQARHNYYFVRALQNYSDQECQF